MSLLPQRHILSENYFESSPIFLITFFAIYLGFHNFYVHNPLHSLNRNYMILKNGIIASVNIFVSILTVTLLSNHNTCFACLAIPEKNTEYNGADSMSWAINLYFWTKITECLDTVFLSLQGKTNYPWVMWHHSFMVILGWIGLTYYPGGQTAVYVAINCISHSLIYTHLFVNYFSPFTYKMRFLQDVYNNIQFTCIFISAVTTMGLKCGYPIGPCVILMCLSLILLASWNKDCLGI